MTATRVVVAGPPRARGTAIGAFTGAFWVRLWRVHVRRALVWLLGAVAGGLVSMPAIRAREQQTPTCRHFAGQTAVRRDGAAGRRTTAEPSAACLDARGYKREMSHCRVKENEQALIPMLVLRSSQSRWAARLTRAMAARRPAAASIIMDARFGHNH